MMEDLEKYDEEVYETFPEDTIPDEATEKDKKAEKEPEDLDAGSNSPSTDLDSIFGKLPPKSLIKTNLLFPKPPRPVTSHKASRRRNPLSIKKQIVVAGDKKDQDATVSTLKTPNKRQSAKKHSVRLRSAPSSSTTSRAPLNKRKNRL